MNVFLSQPMRDKSETYILALREMAAEKLREMFPVEQIVILPSYRPELAGKPRLAALAKSIEMMSEADLVVFLPGSKEAQGCRVELYVCREYGIRYAFYDMVKDEIKEGTAFGNLFGKEKD
ncbi:MAG: hypothetical protein IKN72_06240 [Clostridia bacterium]|nr:hypothetical protein [Clostridia bacterium]